MNKKVAVSVGAVTAGIVAVIGTIFTTQTPTPAPPAAIAHHQQNAIGGQVKCKVSIVARDASGKITSTQEKGDIFVKGFAQLAILNIFGTNQTIKDTSGTNNAETANSAASSPLVAAGTSGTTAAFADNKLGTETETAAATVGSFTSNSFTVSGTVTAGANRTYLEIGMRVTVNGHLYLILHDTISSTPVSSGGTMTITYTLTWA